jgi:hypothetical protein
MRVKIAVNDGIGALGGLCPHRRRRPGVEDAPPRRGRAVGPTRGIPGRCAKAGAGLIKSQAILPVELTIHPAPLLATLR